MKTVKPKNNDSRTTLAEGHTRFFRVSTDPRGPVEMLHHDVEGYVEGDLVQGFKVVDYTTSIGNAGADDYLYAVDEHLAWLASWRRTTRRLRDVHDDLSDARKRREELDARIRDLRKEAERLADVRNVSVDKFSDRS